MEFQERRTYLIKASLQLKYLAGSIGMAVAAALVVYFSFMYALHSSVSSAGIPPEGHLALESAFRSVILWVILFVALVFGTEALVRFHRIAGPLYAMERAVTAYAAGDLSQEIRVRRNDELKDLITDLQVMREGLRRFILQDRELCEEIQKRLARAEELARQAPNGGAIQAEIEAARKDLSLIAAQYKV